MLISLFFYFLKIVVTHHFFLISCDTYPIAYCTVIFTLNFWCGTQIKFWHDRLAELLQYDDNNRWIICQKLHLQSVTSEIRSECQLSISTSTSSVNTFLLIHSCDINLTSDDTCRFEAPLSQLRIELFLCLLRNNFFIFKCRSIILIEWAVNAPETKNQ